MEPVGLIPHCPTEVLRQQGLDLSSTNILVVEDNTAVAGALQRHLTGIGYDVPVVARTVEEALAAVATRRPDLVLMDLQLESEADGIRAAAFLWERHRVPYVYLVPYTEGDPARGLVERIQPQQRLGRSGRPAAIAARSPGPAWEAAALAVARTHVASSIEQLTPASEALHHVPRAEVARGRLAEALGRLREVQEMLAEIASGSSPA